MTEVSTHRRRADSAVVAGDHLVLHRADGGTARVALVVDQLDDAGQRVPLVEDVLTAFPYAEPFTLDDRRREPGAAVAGRRVRLLTTETAARPGLFARFRRHQATPRPTLPPGYDVVLRLGDRRARSVQVAHDVLDLTYVLDLDDDRDDGLAAGLRDRCALQSADLVWCSSRRLMALLRRRWRVEAQLLYPPAEPPVPLAMVAPDRRVLAVVDGASANWLHRLETLARLRPELRVLTHGTPAQPAPKRRTHLLALSDTGPLGFLSEVEGALAVLLPRHDAFDARAIWAQAAGVPVITPSSSASAEVVQGLDERQPTGLILEEGGDEALVDTVSFVEQNGHFWFADHLAAHALRWSRPRFRRTLKSLVLDAWCAHLATATTADAVLPRERAKAPPLEA